MSGKIHSINDRTFEKEVLQEYYPVLVEYSTNRNEPNQTSFPNLEGIAESYASHIKIAKADPDGSIEIRMKYGVHSVPTLMLFRNGKVIATKVGPLSRGQLITFIEGHVLHSLPLNYRQYDLPGYQQKESNYFFTQ